MCSQAPISSGQRLAHAAARAAAGFLRIGIVGDQQHHDAAAQHREEIAPPHARPPFPAADANRGTTRGYVPHRQMWPFMPLTISASLGLGMRCEQAHRAQDHPRRTLAALQRVGFEKGLLHRMQLAFRRQAFDGDDALARHRCRLW